MTHSHPIHDMSRLYLTSTHPPFAIGVMGSAGGAIAQEVRKTVFKLGEEIGRRGYSLVTGVAPGIPHDAVLGAKSQGGLVVGISPALNLREHVEKYNSPTRGYDLIVYTGSGLMGREIENIRSCDAVVIAGGRSGTLGEFAIAYDEAKVIGVLTGTGGIADHIEDLLKVMNKETGAVIVSEPDPIKLVDRLAELYRDRIEPFCDEILAGHDPDGELESGRPPM